MLLQAELSVSGIWPGFDFIIGIGFACGLIPGGSLK
jgi:hypothetical protein